MLPGVRIEDIETTLKVIECKHFTRAGAKLHKDQTTVSRCIKRVEQCIGAELIDRHAPSRASNQGWYPFSLLGAERPSCSRTRVQRDSSRGEPNHSVLHVGYTSYLDLDILAYMQHTASSPDAGFAHNEHSSFDLGDHWLRPFRKMGIAVSSLAQPRWMGWLEFLSIKRPLGW